MMMSVTRWGEGGQEVLSEWVHRGPGARRLTDFGRLVHLFRKPARVVFDAGEFGREERVPVCSEIHHGSVSARTLFGKGPCSLAPGRINERMSLGLWAASTGSHHVRSLHETHTRVVLPSPLSPTSIKVKCPPRLATVGVETPSQPAERTQDKQSWIASSRTNLVPLLVVVMARARGRV